MQHVSDATSLFDRGIYTYSSKLCFNYKFGLTSDMALHPIFTVVDMNLFHTFSRSLSLVDLIRS